MRSVALARHRLAVPAMLVVAVAAAVAWPAAIVLCVLLGLNLLLGEPECVPFSRYPMFSNPPTRAWALRFEDANGGMVPVGVLGIHPVIAKKRFATEVERARAGDVADLDLARSRAAEVLAAEFEQHRPAQGPWATEAVTIALVEYLLQGGALVRLQTSLIETRPS